MRRILAVVLILLFLFAQAAYAEDARLIVPRIDPSVYNPNIDVEAGEYIHPDDPIPDDAPLDDLPHISAEEYPLDDIEFLYDTVYGALPLIDITVDSTTRAEEFVGAPGALMAWRAIYRFLTTQSTADNGAFDFGLREGKIDGRNVTAVYDMLFAYGRAPSREEDAVSWISDDENGYILEAMAPSSRRTARVNAITVGTANDLSVDVSVITENTKGGQEFAYNATVTLLPDQYATYNARVGGIWLRDSAPRFTDAESVYGNGTIQNGENGAINMLDDDDTTLWVFNPSQYPTVTLTASSVQTVRGLCLLPFNASSEQAMAEHSRVRSIRVTLSNGNIYEKEFEDFTDLHQWACVPFEGVQPVNWVRIEILSVYRGSIYGEACISDLYFF